MSKFTDSIKEALAKKQAANHPDAKTEENKTAKVSGKPPVITNKPQKKVTGRGR